jgi:2-dehydropantoate 2-reductase
MDAVHVVGAGGIGLAVGYALRAAGVPVVFVEADAGRRGAIRVDQRPPIAAEFIPFADWTPVPGSWVLLCTKCYDNAAVLEKLTVRVTLLPIQNGFDPRLAAHGHDFEGIASFVSEADRAGPTTRITREGELHLGGRCAEPDAALRELAAALQLAGLFKVKVVERIEAIKYAKLMYNSAISPLAAAAGIDNGKLLSVPAARKLFFSLLQENYAILKASNIELGKVGPFHPRTVAWILRRRWLASMMAKGFEPSLRGTYCSMAGEIQKGRTELDNYNGHLLRLADQTGTHGPLNRAVYELVSKMTADRTTPSLDVLNQL